MSLRLAAAFSSWRTSVALVCAAEAHHVGSELAAEPERRAAAAAEAQAAQSAAAAAAAEEAKQQLQARCDELEAEVEALQEAVASKEAAKAALAAKAVEAERIAEVAEAKAADALASAEQEQLRIETKAADAISAARAEAESFLRPPSLPASAQAEAAAALRAAEERFERELSERASSQVGSDEVAAVFQPKLEALSRMVKEQQAELADGYRFSARSKLGGAVDRKVSLRLAAAFSSWRTSVALVCAAEAHRVGSELAAEPERRAAAAAEAQAAQSAAAAAAAEEAKQQLQARCDELAADVADWQTLNAACEVERDEAVVQLAALQPQLVASAKLIEIQQMEIVDSHHFTAMTKLTAALSEVARLALPAASGRGARLRPSSLLAQRPRGSTRWSPPPQAQLMRRVQLPTFEELRRSRSTKMRSCRGLRGSRHSQLPAAEVYWSGLLSVPRHPSRSSLSSSRARWPTARLPPRHARPHPSRTTRCRRTQRKRWPVACGAGSLQKVGAPARRCEFCGLVTEHNFVSCMECGIAYHSRCLSSSQAARFKGKGWYCDEHAPVKK